MRTYAPHHICRSGRHCLALTGVTADNRCIACRGESHRRAQARYAATSKGDLTDNRYKATAAYFQSRVRATASARGAA